MFCSSPKIGVPRRPSCWRRTGFWLAIPTRVVLPSDHFVADDTSFMEHVVEVLTILEAQPDRIILLGAEPTEPETDYGWITVGAMLPGSGRSPVYRALRFNEKPDHEIANELFASGALWNTSVFAGHAATLIHSGRQCLPALHERLAQLGALGPSTSGGPCGRRTSLRRGPTSHETCWSATPRA
jgi:mannose-1-phosphate guanylyltransferase